MIIKMTHKVYGGTYDFDTITNELTSVLRIHRSDGTIEYTRFPYAYYEDDYDAVKPSALVSTEVT